MTDIRLCVLSDSELKEFDPSQYLEDYSWDIFISQKPVIESIGEIEDDGDYAVYFNLCDGAHNPQEDYGGIEIVRALKELRLPFTRANSHFYDPSREEMQRVAEANGIGFAQGMNLTSVDELDTIESLTYPLLVKHPQSFASTAMGGVGYARCDNRMGPDGELYMIEINPNCGILFKPEDLGPADVMMEYDPQGHAGFLDRIFRAAIIRNQTEIQTSARKRGE